MFGNALFLNKGLVSFFKRVEDGGRQFEAMYWEGGFSLSGPQFRSHEMFAPANSSFPWNAPLLRFSTPSLSSANPLEHSFLSGFIIFVIKIPSFPHLCLYG